MPFLSYDIKGIQHFIFSVPKLKCIIGASGTIDQFDRETAGECGKNAGGDYVFSGGGRGIFFCKDDEVAERLRDELRKAAGKVGLDVRIGIQGSISDAVQKDSLYAYCPEHLSGAPCEMSGLWPVAEGEGAGKKRDVHPLVMRQRSAATQDVLGSRIIFDLKDRGLLPERLSPYDLTFFKTVTTDPTDPNEDADDRREAEAGRVALGNRNRWAVVAMDGNDMGKQHLAAEENWRDDQLSNWLQSMSNQLKDCTWDSLLQALSAVMQAWAEEVDDDVFRACLVKDGKGDGPDRLILPFRPLIVGGDDIILLCHVNYAMSFVETMAKEFHRRSVLAAEKFKQDQPQLGELWPATGNELTISGGILYTKVTFPLHMAIPYAESLLGSAKGEYRSAQRGQLTPAAVDWDSITETLVETPAGRRNRELRFKDGERGVEVILTRRPYRLEPADGDDRDLTSLLQLKEQLSGKAKGENGRGIPTSMRARILPNLRRPWSERVEFVASIAKRQPLLFNLLREDRDKLGEAWRKDTGGKHQYTGLLDALLLLEEDQRMDRQATAHSN